MGWQIYEITHRALDLGLVGLAQFLPGILLFLVAGHTADRFDRKKLLIACYCGFALCSTLLLAGTLYQRAHGMSSVLPIYAVIVLLGVVRSFNGPVSRAILPQVVREEQFQHTRWPGTRRPFKARQILGPSLRQTGLWADERAERGVRGIDRSGGGGDISLHRRW